MSEFKWHYEKDNQPWGPLSEDEILILIREGSIDENTLVWAHPMAEWAPAASVEALKHHFVSSPPQVPHARTELSIDPAPRTVNTGERGPTRTESAAHPIDEDTVTVSQVQPWTRFFARQCDYLTFEFVVLELALFSYLDVRTVLALSLGELILISFIFKFLWVFFEALLLSMYGTTPGKFIFGIRIYDAEGETLTYGAALKRALLVWVKGMGLALPLMNPIMMILGYRQLANNHETSWDRDSGSTVDHHEYSVLSPIFYVLSILLLTFILTIFHH